jgi:hypothetical protein
VESVLSEIVQKGRDTFQAKLHNLFEEVTRYPERVVSALLESLIDKPSSWSNDHALRYSSRWKAPDKHAHKNNVYAHDNDGRRITPGVLDDAQDVILDELRSIYLVGNRLYVANANRMQNSVLCHEGAGVRYQFVSRFVSKDTCPGVVHPFDFTFDDAGFRYVTSHDTNVVTA